MQCRPRRSPIKPSAETPSGAQVPSPKSQADARQPGRTRGIQNQRPPYIEWPTHKLPNLTWLARGRSSQCRGNGSNEVAPGGGANRRLWIESQRPSRCKEDCAKAIVSPIAFQNICDVESTEQACLFSRRHNHGRSRGQPRRQPSFTRKLGRCVAVSYAHLTARAGAVSLGERRRHNPSTNTGCHRQVRRSNERDKTGTREDSGRRSPSQPTAPCRLPLTIVPFQPD